MNIRTNKHRRGFTLVELLVVIAIIVALAALATPQIFKALKRAAMAEAISNVKQVKLALDSFAMDFDGQYPSASTETRLKGTGGGGGGGGAGTLPDSNTAFRQLFWSKNTQSEKIFWVKGSSIAKLNPDDKIADSSGQLVDTEILPSSTCHWAYIQGQSNVDNPSRPIVMDPYKLGETGTFDPNLWDGKGIVLRIDSSARAERLGVTGDGKDKILDGAGENILESTSSSWVGSGLTPSQLIVQPQTGS